MMYNFKHMFERTPVRTRAGQAVGAQTARTSRPSRRLEVGTMLQATGTTLDTRTRTAVGGAESAQAWAAPARRVAGSHGPASVRRVVVPRGGRDAAASRASFRLTARGRLLLRALAAAFVLAVVLVTGARIAGASGSAALGERVAGPGDSLWSISQEIDPDGDPRAMVLRLQELNPEVGTGQLVAGQPLRVPLS